LNPWQGGDFIIASLNESQGERTMHKVPERKYQPFPRVSLPDRHWPQAVIRRAPLWCSQDLRDGNQALVEPMDLGRKRHLYDMLVAIGFRQFEVAFPSASPTEHAFVRHLIEENLVPADGALQVLTPARDDLIERTFDALRGCRRAIVNLYNATAPFFREVVFQKDEAAVVAMAVGAARLIKRLAARQPETDWIFQYTPEAFSTTELAFSRRICDAVVEVFEPSEAHKVIVNLTATVESATPNVFADQIEWMHRHLAHRSSIVLGVHPHNDRGTAVAAAELALMAGAERVEGCLFGNGERTGNVDLVTLALNLYTQGIDPGLDFSAVDEVRRCVERCNQLPVHPRHPYAGELVYTAFSGSHQDAIKKGFQLRSGQSPLDLRWRMPYLPIDPADVGRKYDAVIRVNSQSGKGGVAYLLATEYGLNLPRPLQIELAQAVQRLADASGNEISAAQIYALFRRLYLDLEGRYRYCAHRAMPNPASGVRVALELEVDGVRQRREGAGRDATAAIAAALPTRVEVVDLQVEPIPGPESRSGAYLQVRLPTGEVSLGAGVDRDPEVAGARALFSALNRAGQPTGARP
jgi:2-isopropylmalate synthase